MDRYSTFTVYRQWWRDRYGYECPISEAAFERYLHLNRPQVQPSPKQADCVFDMETERREGWADE